MRRISFILRLFVLLVSLFAFSIPYGFALEDPLEKALLAANWEEVFKRLEGDETKAGDPVARLIMAHACLATNRNNMAASLFISVQIKEELEQWLAFTSSLAQKCPDSAVAHYLYGDALARLNRLNDAHTAFNKSLELDPGFIFSTLAKGILYSLEGKKNEAAYSLNLVEQSTPSSAGILADIGFCWLLLKTPSKALECYEEALRVDSQFGLAYLGKASALYGEGRFEEAMEAIEIASSISPVLSELAEHNQDMVVVGVNRFLYEVIDNERYYF